MMRAFFRLITPAAPLLALLPLLVALSALTPVQAQAQAPAKATAATAAQGPTLLPGSSSHEPINIAADKLDYFDKQQKAVYTGNVVAIQGETRLNATELTILFDRKADAKSGDAKPEAKPVAGPGGANSQLRRMEGKGPIAITNKDQVGTGDALVFDKPENKFYLIGNVALSQGENITRGDKLVYDLNTGQAIVSSKGRVHSLIVPGDQPKPGASAPGTSGAPAKPAPKPGR
jgi:lipopolysaccharide export system protein LptA